MFPLLDRAVERVVAKESEDDEIDKRPDDVPSKATITIKEINDNRYNYSARSVVTTN